MLIAMVGHAAKYTHDYVYMLGFACIYDKLFIESQLSL